MRRPAFRAPAVAPFALTSVAAVLISFAAVLAAFAAALVVPSRAEAREANPDAGRALTVFAAASLREAFGEIGAQFERDHPGARVLFSFAGSQELRLQLEQGGPADVFVSADMRHMLALRSQGLVLEPHTFARNGLALIVPRGNPAAVGSLRDLARARRIVVGAVEVPVGAYTAQVIEAAAREYGAAFAQAVQAHVVSREPNVRQVLAKVELGEADAGVVYRSDALAAGARVESIAIPLAFDQVAEYPIAVAAGSKQKALSALFVQAVLSPAGQAILERRGFGRAGGSR